MGSKLRNLVIIGSLFGVSSFGDVDVTPPPEIHHGGNPLCVQSLNQALAPLTSQQLQAVNQIKVFILNNYYKAPENAMTKQELMESLVHHQVRGEMVNRYIKTLPPMTKVSAEQITSLSEKFKLGHVVEQLQVEAVLKEAGIEYRRPDLIATGINKILRAKEAEHAKKMIEDYVAESGRKYFHPAIYEQGGELIDFVNDPRGLDDTSPLSVMARQIFVKQFSPSVSVGHVYKMADVEKLLNGMTRFGLHFQNHSAALKVLAELVSTYTGKTVEL